MISSRPASDLYKPNSCTWRKVPNNETLIDHITTQHAITKITDLREDKKPFFMAVGFSKPHLCHACPEAYFKYYRMEAGQFMCNLSWQKPPYLPHAKMAQFKEGISNLELGYMPMKLLREMRVAYFACVSYVDELIGRLIGTLKERGLHRTTAIVLTADHGFHLGDNNRYGKYSNHEIANRVPLIIHIPGRTDHGVSSRSLAELVDLFPTLVEAVGLPPIPSCPRQSRDVRLCTDGISLLPLIDKPHVDLKRFAFSQIRLDDPDFQQFTIRSDRYRYISNIYRVNTCGKGDNTTEWRRYRDRLYDLTSDPLETSNLINNSTYNNVIHTLQQQLDQHVYTIKCI